MTFRKEILYSFIDVNGRRIIWYKDVYEAVLKDHPEVNTHLGIIEKTIKNPHQINQDVDYKNRLCYYLLFSGTDQYVNKSMKVVVSYNSLSRRYKILTAYFVDRIKKGEKTIWTKLKNN